MTVLNKLLLHPKTSKQVVLFLQKPNSPLLILGHQGSGKLKLASSIACLALGLKSTKDLSNYPYFIHVRKTQGKQDISIEAVREITRLLRLKTPGKKAVRRIVLLEDSQFLSLEAQNSLLKILEEPNDGTLFMLTAPYEGSLLPTIVSRCQLISVHPVSLEQAAKFYGDQFGTKKMESAWRLSQGSTSLLEALLNEEDSHPLKAEIERAKSFLAVAKYQRLMATNELSKNKEEFSLFLEALAKILAALHRRAIEKNQPRQAQKLMEDRKLTLGLLKVLGQNANSRLIGLKLVTNLKT